MPINLSTSPAFFRWRPACWLRVAGEDAASFLQGQFTNDLRGLESGKSVYGLWLTLKGKILADSFILRGGHANEFWIGSYFSPAATIAERLESHVIADDVAIEDVTTSMAGISLFGEMGWEALRARVGEEAFVFAGRRDQTPAMECVQSQRLALLPWIEAIGAVEVGEEDLARRRIAAGIPAIPIDVGPTDLPQEAGLEAAAISFTKGCYLGQEVMARLKSMGQVRRRLWRVRGTGGNPPGLPAAVFRNERQVGELRSAARDGEGGWIGLAMVSLLHVEPGVELSFAPGGAPGLRLGATP
jgi:folate-binding protein YgfZ